MAQIPPPSPTQIPLPSPTQISPPSPTQISPPSPTQLNKPPEIVYHMTFASETVKRLTANDFELDSKELIALKYDDCILILFYTENTESIQLANIWATAAQQVAGPVFAAINMLSEKRVAEAFTRLKSDGSHPLHWASLRQYPYILVYRRRWPVAVYNGPREVQAIIDYSLTLACQAGYYEPDQIGGSMQAERRIEMGPYQPYIDESGKPAVIRRVSTQYSASEPIRGFNPNLPIVITGSTGAQQVLQTIRGEEQAQQQAARQGIGTSLTEQLEGQPVAPSIATPAAPGTSLTTPTLTA